MTTGRQLVSTLTSDGTLTLALETKEFPAPTGNQVLVQMEAAPINPSDLFLMTTGADLGNAEYSAGKIVAKVHPQVAAGQAARHGKPQTVGNEGAGTVIAAGDGEMAQALMGQRVSCVPGNAFSEYAIADAMMCLPLGDHTAEEGASSFVNPLTALGFVETAKREGHDAIIHAAAASNLGRMLNRICQEDEIALVNIVRKQEQVELLKGIGASHVVNSSDGDFEKDLASAISDSGAYLGFDPIGGGATTDTCLRAMERVAASQMTEYSRYGSNQAKKMYIYGRLDLSPTILTPSYGFGWTVSGWLLMPFLESCDLPTMMALRQRVANGLKTTFASSYKERVGLEEMLTKDAIMDYSQMKTGEKYLVTPHG
ncbi:alcohol dehydrogenase catalytic domain-containing protein [Aurantiacibacter sediminis]|uniref:Alcohol dehydrogenase catalytic domain-containing protein n=1 Tax=Aurantiacibacter sediminis TaxID=2793064 RepID=A0ABS0N5L3_9SPHN|nr:alcohol dehydrogenase catalytic domain-containing protein [Aurantiacibacter sediminis]MBH5323084.1 alcohol dehydrogenase catalytic domain-containing protein [Aurantiacibacter sediminis]